jgi:hypothetical protein
MDPPLPDPHFGKDSLFHEEDMEFLPLSLEDDDEEIQAEEDDDDNFNTPPPSLTIGTVLEKLPKKKNGHLCVLNFHE